MSKLIWFSFVMNCQSMILEVTFKSTMRTTSTEYTLLGKKRMKKVLKEIYRKL